MTERYQRLDKVFQHQLSRERLCQQRAAICHRWLRAVNRRISGLQHGMEQVGAGNWPHHVALVHWHQDKERCLRALQSRLERVRGVGHRLRQRLQDKEAELIRAAQCCRATETALERIEQEVSQARTRNTAKKLDELVRRRLAGERQYSDAAAIRS